MSDTAKKLEVYVNVAILSIALLLGVIIIKRFVLNSNRIDSIHNHDPRVPTGTKIEVPNVNWADSEQTLILALSKDCPFCSKSAPFYRELVSGVRQNRSTRLLAILPQTEVEGQKYMRDLGVSIDDVRQVSFRAINIMATPTLILVGDDGMVKSSWVGKLTSAQETEVLASLGISGVNLTNGNKESETSIEALDLKRLLDANQSVVILDIRDRAEFNQKHISNAKNMPFDEIGTRAINELRDNDHIVVYSDCMQCGNEGKEREAQRNLIDLGFRQTLSLRGGIDSWEQANLPVTTQK